ncbi:MAG: hypothetical protein FIB04_11060 [Gammaproteobacteria bacterium]|nr:hypothetical protein [Gammaproteobacteria bacterium]
MKQRAVRRPGEMWVGAFLVTFGAIAFAADWTPVGTDADGNSYAVDLSRLSREGAVVRVEVRTEYAKPRKDDSTGKDVFVAVDRMAVDCGSSRFAVESRTYVAADGTEIPRGATPRDKLRFRPAAAGSMSEAIVRVACKPRG